MERQELINKIDKRELKKIYLLYGKETFLIEEIQSRFKTIINPAMEDFNLSIIDGKETSIDEIRTTVETLPFMSEKRLVIIKDFELFKGKSKNFSETDEKELLFLLENIAETTLLVFILIGDVDKKKKIYKTVEKFGDICELKKLEDMPLLSWCREQFENREVEIANSDIAYFIEISSYRDRTSEMTLSDLKNEITKLSSYVGIRNKITKKEIDELLSVKSENDIFKLIDMIGSKNSKRALKILNDMLDEGESVLGIFSMLSKQFNQILQVSVLKQERMPQNLIISTLKIHPYRFNKIYRQTKNYNNSGILSIINYISDSDYKIKQGLLNDRLAAEIFVAKYCN